MILCLTPCCLLPFVTQEADKKLKSNAAADIDFKIRHMEHNVKNRDMVLDIIENRLARLEAQAKKE